MILKRVEIFGFKSFGNKGVVEFNDAITGIVGPNGSGKSNIVDAIRWAIGEQRVKSLRGAKMEDVIFSGTEEKRALGYAQVSLTLDNSARVFPIDFDEINVTRKLYRSGESEYSINKSVCRLKDIQELFMDTGLGREGYSIIGQGKIDSIITSSPLERKLLIEEAVGVVKYKTRKLEAERRLERAQNNLYRITDILSEIESRLPVLKRQSERAQRYIELRSELQQIEAGIFVRRMDEFTAKVEKLAKDKLAYDESAARISEELKTLDFSYDDLKREVGGYDMKIAGVNAKIHELITNFETSKVQIKVAMSKIEGLEESIFSRSRETGSIKDNLSRLEFDKSELLDHASSAKREFLSAELEYDDAKSKLAEAEKAKRENDENAQNSAVELEREEANLQKMQSGIRDVLSKTENIKYILEKLKEEETETAARLLQLNREISADKGAEAEITGATEAHNGTKAEFARIRAQIDAAQQRIIAFFSDIQSGESKLKALKGYEASMQGYRYGIRKLNEYKNKNAQAASEIFGTVGDIITTDAKYAQAISRALGAAVEYMAVSDEKAATRLIGLLKSNNWGRATFLPVNIIKGSRGNFSDIQAMKGFVGAASDLVDYDKRFANIVGNLLGKVAVLDTIDNANEAARKTSYKYKIVTLEGEVLFPGGAIVGGNSKDDDGGILKRKSEIETLEKSIEKNKASYEALLSDKNALESELEKARTALEAREEELIRVKDAHREILLKKKAMEDEAQALEDRLSKNKLQENILKNDKDALETEYISLTEKNEIAAGIVAQLREQISTDVISRYNQNYIDAVSAKNAFEIKYMQAKENSEKLLERISIIDEKVELAEIDIKNKQTEIGHFQDEITTLREHIEYYTQIDTDYDLTKKALDDEYLTLSENKTKSNAEYIRVNDRIIELNKERSKVSEQIYKLSAGIEKAELEMNHLQQNMLEDYSLTYASAVPYKSDIDLNEGIRRAEDLKGRIKKLGNINADALEEYKEVRERFEMMSAQRDDLTSSKQELEKIIHDLTVNMNHRFNVQFELIQKEFDKSFKQLFDGGHAKLILTEPDDVYESGVDIIARPPKTKLQNIAALSGGEKALCAIALIMAILKIKPSPFCVLDEIDAALDEANVERFGRYLRSIKDENQFVVITHKRKTMEMSDALYGASMGSDGVTRLISVKLTQIDSKGEVVNV